MKNVLHTSVLRTSFFYIIMSEPHTELNSRKNSYTSNLTPLNLPEPFLSRLDYHLFYSLQNFLNEYPSIQKNESVRLSKISSKSKPTPFYKEGIDKLPKR